MSGRTNVVRIALAGLLTSALPSISMAQDDEPVFGPDGTEAADDDTNKDGAAKKDGDAKKGDEGEDEDEDGDAAGESSADPAETEAPEAGDATADGAISKSASAPSKLFKINGYIQPQFDFRYRPDAFPRDRTNYGAGATRTGLIMSGEPLDKWSYTFHVIMSAGLLSKVVDVETIDVDGDGSPDRIGVRRDTDAGIFIERAVVDYTPLETVRVRLGQMRIPFTIQNQSPNFSLMFPDRSGPNQFFLSGTDLGGLVTYAHPLFQASAGIFNGTGANNTTSSVRGVLYALRFDVNPLGEFPFSEVLNRSGPFRVGFGAGILYFPSEQFEASGFEGINVRDLRASLSARLKMGGLYAQAEILRRQQTDNLSSRPVIATGGYAQGSYYIPVRPDRFGVTPIVRGGVTVEDQSFEPRTSLLTEAGLALHWHRGPEAADTIKFIVQYFGEQRITEGEDAFGATTQLQLQF